MGNQHWRRPQEVRHWYGNEDKARIISNINTHDKHLPRIHHGEQHEQSGGKLITVLLMVSDRLSGEGEYRVTPKGQVQWLHFSNAGVLDCVIEGWWWDRMICFVASQQSETQRKQWFFFWESGPARQALWRRWGLDRAGPRRAAGRAFQREEMSSTLGVTCNVCLVWRRKY